MAVPDDVRAEVQSLLWAEADALDWSSLSSSKKSLHYESWTKSDNVGGVLARYLDKGQIRVYVKDTLLKTYTQSKLADPQIALRVFRFDEADILKRFVKPNGLMTIDRQIITWGSAADWKLTVLGLYERGQKTFGSRMRGMLLLHSVAYFHDPKMLEIVKSACDRLGIEELQTI